MQAFHLYQGENFLTFVGLLNTPCPSITAKKSQDKAPKNSKKSLKDPKITNQKIKIKTKTNQSTFPLPLPQNKQTTQPTSHKKKQKPKNNKKNPPHKIEKTPIQNKPQ